MSLPTIAPSKRRCVELKKLVSFAFCSLPLATDKDNRIDQRFLQFRREGTIGFMAWPGVRMVIEIALRTSVARL